MYYKIKISNMPGIKGILTYLTEAIDFKDITNKLLNQITGDVEIEEVKLMKNFKPAINEIYDSANKLYIVKIAEDMQIEDKIKTIKYELPVFANNSNELHQIVNNYIAQGLDNMRLTTISETKWLYLP